MNLKTVVQAIIVCLLLYSSCSRKEKSSEINSTAIVNQKEKADSSANSDTLTTDLKKKEIQYTLNVLNDSTINAYVKLYDDTSWRIICAINRIDPNRLHRADSILIPDTVSHDLMDYSPFPLKLDHSAFGEKFIFVSYTIQAFALYRNDSLLRWGPVSMGAKKSKTPTGQYFTNWKSKKQISTEDSTWILNWYFNIINSSGVSFHEYELPGFPASHSCIRLRQEDAMFLYHFADQWQLDETGRTILKQGTPVIVFGSYPWGKTRPWFNLARNARNTNIEADSLKLTIEKYSPKTTGE
jgi:lipoprotein-anchoring transpeptidase ErfK/SrfK